MLNISICLTHVINKYILELNFFYVINNQIDTDMHHWYELLSLWTTVELIEVSQVILAIMSGWLEKTWKENRKAFKLQDINLDLIELF